MLGDRGLAPFESSFDHAVLVLLARRAGTRVAEVNLNSSEMFVKVGHFVLNQTLDEVCEGFTPFDAVVCTDFDVHAGSLRKFPRK